MGIYWDNGKENGNYRDYGVYIGIIGDILGIYWDNGKENGNYRGLSRDYRVCLGSRGYTTPIMENQMEKKMETTISGLGKILEIWFN